MKTDMSLPEMAAELQRRENVKHDFLYPTKELHLQPTEAGQQLVLENGNDLAFDVTKHTHRQLGTWAGVPAKYYDRMLNEAPDLLAGNINHWLKKSDKKRMVRTLDGNARAFLSDRYRRIDNEDVARMVLPTLLDSSNFTQVVSTSVTDSFLHIKAIFPQVEAEIKVGDVVRSGVAIKNCEIGLSRLMILPFVDRLVCSNGMIVPEYGLNKMHIGRRIETSAAFEYQLFQDDTLKADDEALMLQVRDMVMALSKPEFFTQIVDKMREAAESKKIEKPVEAVELLAKDFVLNEPEKQDVLENLIRGGDYSKGGALNAVTATANNHESYDRATELEAMGGKILDLPANQWKVIAEAA